MLVNILSYMVMSQDISIGLILGYCSIVFMFGMIIFYVFFENIKRYYNIICNDINYNQSKSVNEEKHLLVHDLEGYELV